MAPIVSTLADAPEKSQRDRVSLRDTDKFETRGARVTPLSDDSEFAVRVDFDNSAATRNISRIVDLSGAAAASLSLCNTSKESRHFEVRFEDANTPSSSEPVTYYLTYVPPGGSVEVYLPLYYGQSLLDGTLKLAGARGKPGAVFQSMNAVRMVVSNSGQASDSSAELSDIRLEGAPPTAVTKAADFFPFVDEFGQYLHATWPGKVASSDDLAKDVARETADIAAHGAPPEGWDRYGGWEGGPALEATGMFRVEKRDGKWWLVDPEGRLFWSHGMVTATPADTVTGVTDREGYFSSVPKKGALGEFYKPGPWKAGIYEKYSDFEVYNFLEANLYRKYGADWDDAFNKSLESRFRSWRLNSVGAFSYSWHRPVFLPYVPMLSSGGSPRIAGSKVVWQRFPDPFDEGFREAIRENMKEHKATDPLRIGFFLDNELPWGYDSLTLATAALRSPASQAAKIALVDFLRGKYPDIESLNKVWGTRHADWDALLASTAAPSGSGEMNADLRTFNGLVADEYFKVYREEVDQVFPGSLMFSSRFAGPPDKSILESAAKYCDVIAINLYHPTAEGVRLPDGIDKPVIVSEFNFSAPDRGLVHPGLNPTRNQAERAAAYKRYIRSALANPQIVGTHWFQLYDEAVSGRPDGESYQAGFVDICDRPYPEFIKAVRSIGGRMYEIRQAAPASLP